MEPSPLLPTLALLALWIAASWAWGRAFLPLSRHIFPNLPDGGLAAGRLLALVLVALLAYLGASLGVVSLQFSPLLVLAAPLALQYYTRRQPAQRAEFLAWARSKSRDLLISDGLFVLAWLVFAWIRLQNPALSDLEKPMDAGLLASATRASWLPFENFWMAGVPFTNYYYFFPILGSLPARTLATPPHVAYNLVQPLFCALFASILAALCASVCRPREHASRAWSFAAWGRGAWAMSIVAWLGNWEPLRQMHEAGHWLGPSELDWWKTSRVIEHTINEYPAFTQTTGDIHAHFYALSVGALLLSLAWALFDKPQVLEAIAPAAVVVPARPRVQVELQQREPQPVATASVRKSKGGKSKKRRSKARVAGAVHASSSASVATLEAPQVAEAMEDLEPEEELASAPRTPPTAPAPMPPKKVPRGEGWLLRWARVLSIGALLGASIVGNTWDVPLYVLLSAGCLYLSGHHDSGSASEESKRRLAKFAAEMGVALLVAVALALPYLSRFRSQVQGVQREFWLPNTIEWALMWGGIVILACLAIKGARQVDEARRNWWQVLAACGALALFAPSFFYIRGAFGEGDFRHQDTVFKFGLHAWLLLGTSGACGVWWLLDSRSKMQRRLGVAAWAAAWAVPLLCTMCVVSMRTVAMKSPIAPSLEGAFPIADAGAIDWLSANAPKGSVVLEAVKPYKYLDEPPGDYYNYKEFGRVAALSGVPTPVGWTGHLGYWGADFNRDVMPRLQTVRATWNSPDAESARENLRALGVTHIFIGEVERRIYTPQAIEILKGTGTIVHTDGDAVVVRVATK